MLEVGEGGVAHGLLRAGNLLLLCLRKISGLILLVLDIPCLLEHGPVTGPLGIGRLSQRSNLLELAIYSSFLNILRPNGTGVGEVGAAALNHHLALVLDLA